MSGTTHPDGKPESFRLKPFLLFLTAVLVAPVAQADTEILSNGGFETGDFTGWEVGELGGSALFVESGIPSPATGSETVGAASGSYYAVADGLPGATALVQTFTLGTPVSMAKLSFDMFVNSGASGQVHASGLDPTAGGSFEPNQHVRVDILSAGADPFDTGAGVLANFTLGIDGPVNATNPYVHHEVDVTALLAAGGSYQLRFAQVNNDAYLIQGVDNVSLTVAPVPEPETYALMLSGLGLVGLVASRRQAR